MDSKDLAQDIRRYLHDLVQPLSALSGLVDLLLMEMHQSDPKLREVRLISEQLEKVLQIVAEIRRLAQETSGSDPARRDPLPLQGQ